MMQGTSKSICEKPTMTSPRTCINLRTVVSGAWSEEDILIVVERLAIDFHIG